MDCPEGKCKYTDVPQHDQSCSLEGKNVVEASFLTIEQPLGLKYVGIINCF